MTPKEALEKLRNKHYFVDFELDTTVGKDCKEELDIIESAINDYEKMKQTRIIFDCKKISDDDLEKLKNGRVFVGNVEHCKVEPLFDEETQKKLEALDKINTMFLAYAPRDIREDKGLNEDLFECIKTAIKRLETLEEEKQSFDKAIEKKLKALEIIKEKGVDVWWLQTINNFQSYNERFDEKDVQLTEEEYELLKEILNEKD